MTEIEARGVRTRRLSRSQVALIGSEDAVRAAMDQARAARAPVTFDRPQQLDRAADVVVVATRTDGRESTSPARTGIHPGWIVGILAAAAAALVALAVLLYVVMGALIAALPLLCGVVALVAIVTVLAGRAGGNRYTQNMFIGR